MGDVWIGVMEKERAKREREIRLFLLFSGNKKRKTSGGKHV
jgi:hypothetical protein